MSDDLRVVVAHDGALACLVEPQQVIVFALPALERIAEVGIDEGSDVALAGNPVRLLVVAPRGVMYVVDPRGADGPEKLADLELDPGTRILATSGAHVMVASASGAAFVNVGEGALARLPSRAAITAAGAAALPDHFVVTTAGVLEEWSATTRAPLRRFRLDRQVTARFLGASPRHIWFVPEATPEQIVIVPIAASARHVRIDLPQPALHAAADPFGHSVAIVGATNRAAFVIGLADRSVTQIHAGPVDDVAWRGAHSVLCAREAAIEIVELAHVEAGQSERAVTERPVAEAERPAQPSTFARLSAWKQRMAARGHEARRAEPVVELVGEPASEADVPATHEWRDALALWARRQLTGAEVDRPLVAAGPLHDIGARLGLIGDDATMLWLVYAARLCGHDGVAPSDLVAVCPRRWDDALVRGKIAATGAFRWRRNRVDLKPEVTIALDERPPRNGVVFASRTELADTIAIVAPTDVDVAALAAWAAPDHGGLFAPNQRGLARPARFLLEARVRGLAPLIPWGQFAAPCEPPRGSAVVVADPAAAAALGLPIARTWSA